jgi:hypothetical protein
MNIHAKLFCAAAVAGFAYVAASPAHALTAQECSAKYQAAKAAGTLAGQKWNDFRKAQCGADAAPAPAAAAPAAAAPAPKKETKAAPAPAPAAAPAGPVNFPTAVDPKFSSEKAHLGRLHTCSEAWKANKAANTTGGMQWRGAGGFYSECNKRLKG